MEDNKTLHAVKVGNNTKEYTITEKRMKRICENDKDEKIRQKKHDKRQGQEEE